MKKTNDDSDKAFCKALNSGLSTNALAERFGITPDEAYERAVECMHRDRFYEKPYENHRKSRVDDKLLATMMAAGISRSWAADFFGVSIDTIRCRLRMIAQDKAQDKAQRGAYVGRG